MDVFYEESAVNQNSEKGQKTYKILHITSWFFMVAWILMLVITILFIPGCKPAPTDFGNASDYDAAIGEYYWIIARCLFLLCITSLLFSIWFCLSYIKKKVNISYDYIFVSGDLRIAKVFNVNRRKLAARISCEDMIQIGDVDNSSFERFSASPDTKTVYLTPNTTAAEDKFFMYILVGEGNGKTLYVLEARELLLMNILKFARRSVLERDYVMQEKKNV